MIGNPQDRKYWPYGLGFKWCRAKKAGCADRKRSSTRRTV